MQRQGLWRRLDFQQDGLPTLLIRASFSKTEYEVHLSDLSRVWGHSPSRREITRQALNRDSPIDPSEDAGQMEMLLGKLESALNQADDTKLNIESKAGSEQDLLIQISVTLPSPLATLEWTMELQQLPQQHVSAELVIPLLIEADLLRRQMKQLISEIQDRDRVVFKLSDRLENSGNDLTAVFPGVSSIKKSRKITQRDQLARHVKGLGDFDETDWRARKAEESAGDALSPKAMENVLAQLSVPRLPVHIEDTSSDWWLTMDHSIPTKPSLSKIDQIIELGQGASADHAPENTIRNGDQDNGFERQPTPPNQRQVLLERAPVFSANNALAQTNSAPMDDESTEGEDDDDLDAPPRKSATSSQSLPKRSQPSAKSPSKSQSSEPTNATTEEPASSAPKPRKFGVLGGRSATSKSPQPYDQNAQAKATNSGPPKKAAPKAKLGTIGGKAKSTTPAPPEPATSEQVTPSKLTKLGTIGGKKDNFAGTPSKASSAAPETGDQVNEESEDRTRSSKQSTPPAARETSQERADNRREQLKRELEEKAKAPVKKKRRF
ncbi:hypothetical protein MBLNU230_g3478t1 [Neophaeotheca triangularis]